MNLDSFFEDQMCLFLEGLIYHNFLSSHLGRMHHMLYRKYFCTNLRKAECRLMSFLIARPEIVFLSVGKFCFTIVIAERIPYLFKIVKYKFLCFHIENK